MQGIYLPSLKGDHKKLTTEVNTLTEEQSLQKRNARWYGNIIFVAVMVFLAISFIVSNPSPDNLGWYTLVPSVFVITFIFWTKEIILAYILGGLMGHYMVNRGDFSCPTGIPYMIP